MSVKKDKESLKCLQIEDFDEEKSGKYKNIEYSIFRLKNGKRYLCPICGCSVKSVARYDSTSEWICVKCLQNSLYKKISQKKKKKKNHMQWTVGIDAMEEIKCSNPTIIQVLIEETINGKIKWIAHKAFDNEILYVKFIPEGSFVEGKDIYIVKTDNGERLNYTYYDKTSKKRIYLYDELEIAIMNSKPTIIPVRIAKKTEEEKKEAEEKRKQNAKEERQKQKLLKEARRKEQEKIRKQQQQIKVEKKRKQEEAEKENRERRIKERYLKDQEELKKLPQIGVKDFVVRRSVFKCMHNKHRIKNLSAAVRIINNKNEECLARVSAGYCSDCNMYFILDSTYENLKRIGIPICRMCDEKTYLKNTSVNGMILAQESILMQYGYNVGQMEGLSSSRRQKILAVLIDKKILSKSEIISYLDFFISQRQSQSKYQVAISKWEMDREFVENYRIGQYQQFAVSSLSKY